MNSSRYKLRPSDDKKLSVLLFRPKDVIQREEFISSLT